MVLDWLCPKMCINAFKIGVSTATGIGGFHRSDFVTDRKVPTGIIENNKTSMVTYKQKSELTIRHFQRSISDIPV